MAYDESFANRIREALFELRDCEEKRMFGGLCFMLEEKMLVCIRENDLLCRIGKSQAELELQNDSCRQMISRGKVMKDFVYVDTIEVKTSHDLQYWITLALNFHQENKIVKNKKA